MGDAPIASDPAPPPGNPHARGDAVAVVRRLRGAGHVAYFAGGCVRDLLLGREPKDYDVATDAPPDRVRALFSHAQAVGAAFGVILVRQRWTPIEVATFRHDGAYLDGRRPVGVQFTTADEDARRRDFTINGLFLDPLLDVPLEGQVIDYVGGRDDLRAGVIRAIGDPEQRFAEDHLRLLRAVRFAARLGFTIEPATAGAILRHAPQLARISPERVGEELRALLVAPTRPLAWRLLGELGLNLVVFRFVEVPPGEADWARDLNTFFSRLAPRREISLGLALAGATLQQVWWSLPAALDLRGQLARSRVQHFVQALRRATKISNETSDEVQGALEGLGLLVRADPPTIPGVAALKRFLARPTAPHSRELLHAFGELFGLDHVVQIEARLADLETTEFAPPPLVTGDDLTAAGLKPGPIFREILDAVYDAQLEGRVVERGEASALARELAKKCQE